MDTAANPAAWYSNTVRLTLVTPPNETQECRTSREGLQVRILDYVDVEAKEIYVSDGWFDLEQRRKLRVLNHAERCLGLTRVRLSGTGEAVASRGWRGDRFK